MRFFEVPSILLSIAPWFSFYISVCLRHDYHLLEKRILDLSTLKALHLRSELLPDNAF